MGKTIFITGAGSWLGRGAALGLEKQGHRVIATTEITSQKTDLMREVRERGLDMEVFKLDITNERDRARIDNLRYTRNPFSLLQESWSKKGKGEIVFLSSMAGIITTLYGGPYAATKHAIEGMALTLKDELEEFGVQDATINPGAYNTGFKERAARILQEQMI